MGGPSRLCGQGRFAHRVWSKPFYLFLGLSSEAFIGLCEPTQYMLCYAFIHVLAANEHLLCMAVPMHRIVIRHG